MVIGSVVFHARGAGVVAAVLVLVAIFREMRSLAARAIPNDHPDVPNDFRTMFSLAPLTAVARRRDEIRRADAPPTTILCGRLFDRRARLDAGFGVAVRRDGALRRCGLRRHRRRALDLARVLSSGRAPWAASLSLRPPGRRLQRVPARSPRRGPERRRIGRGFHLPASQPQPQPRRPPARPHQGSPAPGNGSSEVSTITAGDSAGAALAPSSGAS